MYAMLLLMGKPISNHNQSFLKIIIFVLTNSTILYDKIILYK
jgi:hypothetical protein